MPEMEAEVYFDMIGPSGERRGLFKITHTHLLGKSITYRPARWYERLWLWLIRANIKTWKLNYDN